MENAQNKANLLSYDLNNIAALDEWLIKVQNNDPSLKFKFDSITINDAPSVAIKNTAEFGEIIQIIQNLPFSLKRTNNSFCTVEISNYDSDGTLRPEPNIKLNFNIFGWIQDAEPYASVKDFKQDCLKLASFRNRIYILKHPDEEIELEDDDEEIEVPTPTTHLEEPKDTSDTIEVENKEKPDETTGDEVATNNQAEQKDETPSENETSHKEAPNESESTNDNASEETVINTQAAFANSTSSNASSFMAPTTIDKFADAISRILDRIDSRPAINLNSREQMMRQRDHMLALTLQDLEPVNTIN